MPPTGTPPPAGAQSPAPALSKNELESAEEKSVYIQVPGLCGQYATARFGNDGISEEPVPPALAKEILGRFTTAKVVEKAGK